VTARAVALKAISYKNRTYITKLSLMLEELRQAGWRGQDVFRQYRAKLGPDTQALVATAGVTIEIPDGSEPIERIRGNDDRERRRDVRVASLVTPLGSQHQVALRPL